MLVLSRRQGEVVVIGGNIRVEVLEISGQRVRLGIYAPSNVSVDREEIWVRKSKEAENEAANRSVSGVRSNSNLTLPPLPSRRRNTSK